MKFKVGDRLVWIGTRKNFVIDVLGITGNYYKVKQVGRGVPVEMPREIIEKKYQLDHKLGRMLRDI